MTEDSCTQIALKQIREKEDLAQKERFDAAVKKQKEEYTSTNGTDWRCCKCHKILKFGATNCPECFPQYSEAVDHPAHYHAGQFEVIKVLEGWGLINDFCLGNAIKYIARARHKNNFTEDIKKAIWYLQYSIGENRK